MASHVLTTSRTSEKRFIKMQPPRLSGISSTLKKGMSFSTIKRSVVWIDKERKVAKETQKAREESQGTTSPSTWIDLRSEVSSEDYDGITLSSVDNYTFASETASYFTPPLTFQQSAGYDNGFPAYYERTSRVVLDGDQDSVAEKSEVSEESQVIYPDPVRLLLIALSISLSLFLVALDRTIISTAIPQITVDFQSLQDAGFYYSAYLLTNTALMPTWGKVFQNFDLKYTFISVMSIFTLGSLICALSPNSACFIIARTISGLGAGGMFAGGLTIIAYSVPLHRRPAYQGVLGGVYGIANFVGPLLGGVFTDRLTWRWCFWINLPLGALSIVGVVFFFQSPKRPENNTPFKERLQELDFLGPSLFIPSVACLLLALQFGGTTDPWGSLKVLSLLAVFIALIPLWVYSQFRLGEKATIPPRLLLQRTVFFASWYSFCIGATSVIILLFIPMYFQAVRESSAVESGVRLLPYILSSTVTALLGGIAMSFVGYAMPFMAIGGAFLTIGSGLFTMLSVDTPTAVWAISQIIAGLGIGGNMNSPLIAVQAVIKLRDVPIAIATTIFFGILGGTLFSTISQTIQLNVLLPQLQILDPSLTSSDIIAAGATGIRNLVSEILLPDLLTAYAKSIDKAFIVAIVMSAIATGLAFGVEWKNTKKKSNRNSKAEKEQPVESIVL